MRRLRIDSTLLPRIVKHPWILLLGLELIDLYLLLALSELIFMPEIGRHVPVLGVLRAEPGNSTLMIRGRTTCSIIIHVFHNGLTADRTAFLGWSPRVLQMIGCCYTLDSNDIVFDALPAMLIFHLLGTCCCVAWLLIVGQANESVNCFNSWRCGWLLLLQYGVLILRFATLLCRVFHIFEKVID